MEAKIQNYTGWQSDVIVDLIKRYDFPYITLNPGASFRGLHDSLVNYGDNKPPMMLCNHEEIAVQIAHGYAKATGRPMAVILHDLVGLLHACMAIYYAYIDRVPIFIMGATGPMDEAKRRPHIDWTHSALVQGNAIRDYVKWDYQPTAIEGVPESFARAYSVMMTQPQGPIYMCYDAALQEAQKTHDVPLPPANAVATPSPIAPDPRAIEAIADKLLKAEHPMLLAEYVGRRAGGFEGMVELAETAIGIPELTRIGKARIAGNAKLKQRIEERKIAIGKRHDQVWAKWQEDARRNWDASPITFQRLALEVWEVIKNEDWVLTANNLKQKVRKLWDFDKPYRHPGVELGTSTQIGISLGVALAHKDKGRIAVDINPDGDLMFDAGALWIAAKYQIPMLVVMHNNRAYYNDWEHQIRMARMRGTDEAKAHIGMDLFGPEPDFGALARSMGCYGEGPIDNPKDIRPALLRALTEVKKGRLALVDTITQHR